jgi:hypothetical protein
VDRIPFTVYDFFGYLATGFLLLVATDYALGHSPLATPNPTIVASVFWVLIAYVVGHLVAHLSSWLVEANFLRKVLKSPEEHLFGERKLKGWARIFPGNYAPFPKPTQERITEKARREGIEVPARSLFLHCHPLVKRDQATLARLNSFLNLYGFCRNLTMGLSLAAIMLVLGAVRSISLHPLKVLDGAPLWWALAALVGSVGMFYRYLKFFRHYTTEVFVTYAELPD